MRLATERFRARVYSCTIYTASWDAQTLIASFALLCHLTFAPAQPTLVATSTVDLNRFVLAST